MQVQDVYYGDAAIKFKMNSIDSTAFYGKPSERYLLDDYTRVPVMVEVMREYVPGVMVRKRRDGFHFLVLDNGIAGVLGVFEIYDRRAPTGFGPHGVEDTLNGDTFNYVGIDHFP